MLGSKKRDYVSEGDRISATVQQHLARKKELVGERGLSWSEASKIAYDEIVNGEHSDAIKSRIKRIVDIRNGRD